MVMHGYAENCLTLVKIDIFSNFFSHSCQMCYKTASYLNLDT